MCPLTAGIRSVGRIISPAMEKDTPHPADVAKLQVWYFFVSAWPHDFYDFIRLWLRLWLQQIM